MDTCKTLLRMQNKQHRKLDIHTRTHIYIHIYSVFRMGIGPKISQVCLCCCFSVSFWIQLHIIKKHLRLDYQMASLLCLCMIWESVAIHSEWAKRSTTTTTTNWSFSHKRESEIEKVFQLWIVPFASHSSSYISIRDWCFSKDLRVSWVP